MAPAPAPARRQSHGGRAPWIAEPARIGDGAGRSEKASIVWLQLSTHRGHGRAACWSLASREEVVTRRRQPGRNGGSQFTRGRDDEEVVSASRVGTTKGKAGVGVGVRVRETREQIRESGRRCILARRNETTGNPPRARHAGTPPPARTADPELFQVAASIRVALSPGRGRCGGAGRRRLFVLAGCRPPFAGRRRRWRKDRRERNGANGRATAGLRSRAKGYSTRAMVHGQW
jgi:hypothetical protein